MASNIKFMLTALIGVCVLSHQLSNCSPLPLDAAADTEIATPSQLTSAESSPPPAVESLTKTSAIIKKTQKQPKNVYKKIRFDDNSVTNRNGRASKFEAYPVYGIANGHFAVKIYTLN